MVKKAIGSLGLPGDDADGRNFGYPRRFWRKGTRDAPGGELSNSIVVNGVGSHVAGWEVTASVTHMNPKTT